jgi:hypothetical protein
LHFDVHVAGFQSLAPTGVMQQTEQFSGAFLMSFVTLLCKVSGVISA